MTIDERLEALAQSLELQQFAQRDTDKKIRRLAVVTEQNEVRSGQMMDAVRSLARAMENREQRSLGLNCSDA